MSPQEQLLALEIEFRRMLQCEAPGTADASAMHTSYALQYGCETLLHGVGRVTARDFERLANRFLLEGDPRDV
jgi:hypothetical protein